MTDTEPFDASRYLATPEAQAELLGDAFASGNAAYVAQALGVIARARITQRRGRPALDPAAGGDAGPD
ncbi:MAG: hypothetical protein HQL40_19630 [Alphaproteobacteria bacterium]|nr:hypothetical protein [Alphaproteobacteria bacterium]